jgi:hypothetical protein
MKCLLGIAVVFFLSTAQAQTYIQLVLDLSGSMYEKLESGEPKIDAARLVLTDFISSLPHDNLNVGLRVYGATTGAMDAGACEDSQLAVGMQGVDKDTLLGIVSTTNPKGATPIAYSLQQAVADFQGISAEAEKIIVLVTDGEESCGGDLQAALAAFESLGIKVDLRIVGLGLSEAAAQSFEGVGATFENALDTTSFAAALEATLPTEVVPTESVAVAANETAWTFDNDFLGWRVIGDPREPLPEFVVEDNNGFICATDGGKGIYWYFETPLDFPDAEKNYYGFELGFDLKQAPTATSQVRDIGDVILQGNVASVTHNLGATPDTTWTTFRVKFDETATWLITGTEQTASLEELQQVLANLQSIQIRGEYRRGNDTGCLDNVRLIGSD